MAGQSIRLGFVDGDHLHFGGLLQSALECHTADVVGMVIEDPELRSWFASRYDGVAVFETAEELYETGRPAAIVTCADNLNAADVIADAAARGVHVMKEKPMAASLEVAERMATTAALHGIRLMINWPTNWSAANHHAKQLIDAGEIGDVWQVHHRAGHGGPPATYLTGGPVGRIGWGWLVDRERNGAGAAIDFCSYGAVLSRWIMGQPGKVLAMGGRYSKEFFTVEDNAVMILGYPRGHSICEATWTQPAIPVQIPPMIYGDKGAIAVTGQTELRVANAGGPGERSSREGRTVEVPALPAQFQSAVAYFTHCLLHDEPFAGMVEPRISRDAQEILEAGLTSMATGAEVSLPLSSFLT